MVHHEEGFLDVDGARLWTEDDVPSGARAHVLVVHGYADHLGRYRALRDSLLAESFAVHTYDQRGHGKSPGPRGHVQKFKDYLDDFDRCLARMRTQGGNSRAFVIAHSHGGLEALAALQRRGRPWSTASSSPRPTWRSRLHRRPGRPCWPGFWKASFRRCASLWTWTCRPSVGTRPGCAPPTATRCTIGWERLAGSPNPRAPRRTSWHTAPTSTVQSFSFWGRMTESPRLKPRANSSRRWGRRTEPCVNTRGCDTSCSTSWERKKFFATSVAGYPSICSVRFL